MKKLLCCVCCIILILPIFSATIVTLFSSKGYNFNPVTPTGSMYPTIKNGNIILVNWKVDLDQNFTGKIIVFGKTMPMPICHRCIADNGEWLITRGDANNSTEHLTRDEILGIFIKVSTNQILDTLQYGLLSA